MQTLHFYITRQILGGLGITVLVFMFVLVLGNLLKEVLGLLASGQATLGLVAQALGLLIPFVLVYALPMGLLTATLLVFGRLSAEQELTAARSGGISLVALASPVFLLATAASCLAIWINLELAPRARSAYKDLFHRVAAERAANFLEPGRFITDLDGFIVYIGDKRGDQLENVSIYELGEAQTPRRQLRAERAEILTDAANVEVVLRLYRVTYYDFTQLQSFFSEQVDAFRLSYRRETNAGRRVSIKHMTFMELRETLWELETLSSGLSPPAGATGEQLREYRLRVNDIRTELITPVRFRMHRQVAFSFASLGFTLVGVALGVRAHRRETSVGIALALLLVAVYYAFMILAESLEDQPQYGPHLIVWIPNFIFQVAGAALLWRANRGF